VLAAAAFSVLVAIGCQDQGPRLGAVPVDPQDRVSQNMFPALRGTIGEYAVLADSNPIPVEGYGVVAYLPKTGSGDADPRIREMLINQLVVEGVGLHSQGTAEISPERILASNEVSVVEVRGIIPPLARKGTVFDLYINALPDSGTTSLAHGLLWTSELKIRGLTLMGDDSAVIAKGRGPVFIPSTLEAAARGKPEEAPRALRSGRVIAGGVVSADRAARLQVRTKNALLTKLIERVINARFPNERDKVADALDDMVVNLKIPREYSNNPMDMIDQIMHLYLTPNEPGYIQMKAQEIVAGLQMDGAPHRSLGRALEGLGRSILPDYIQPHYTAANLDLRFWSARAGAMMQDTAGEIVLQEFARSPNSPYRKQAVASMIEARRGRDTERATVTLVEMLNSLNTEDRILAYHGMLAMRSRGMATYDVGKKFMMDIVPADSPPLIYILEAESPRIAFIGRPVQVPVGATFVSHDKLFTVRVDDEDEIRVNTAARIDPRELKALEGIIPDSKIRDKNQTVTLYYRPPLGGPAKEVRTSQDLPSLVARASWIPDPNSKDPVPYIGASYQRITEVLAAMAADKTIDAQVVVQHVPDAIINPTDLVLSGRSEGSTLKPQEPDAGQAPVAPNGAPAGPEAPAPRP
jgi:flagellar basal body P-ring protein FlgI